MGIVIPLNNVTRLDIPPERVLAVIPKLQGVVLMGRDKDGNDYFASSYADGGEVLWLMEKCKHALMGFSE